jgi:hypothetical protein
MINPADATQLTLLSVQATFGSYPVSVAVNNMYACVLTGGSVTGIRCFTYNSTGLYVMPSFDRNLTSYISQTLPPTGPPQTMSDIIFSPDNLALIVSVKGVNSTIPGYLLFFLLTNSNSMSSNPIQTVVTGGILPFSLTPVGNNGLLFTDQGANGVLTLTYSSTSGLANNYVLTPINTTLARALCWSTYSPTIGNYYVIGGSGGIVELSINLNSATSPVQIVNSYQVPPNNGALDGTVVTLAGKDYLYVIGAMAYAINGFQLNAAGNATLVTVDALQQSGTGNVSALAGIAAFVQTQSSSSGAASLFISTITIMISIVLLSFDCK